MKMLFITQLLPFPRDSGGNIINFELLHILSKHNEIYFVSFVDNKKEYKNILTLKKYCKTVYVEARALIYRHHRVQLFFKFICSLITFKSYLITKFYSSSMKINLEKIIEDNGIETLLVVHETMLQYIPKRFTGKVIYIEIDVNSSIYYQYADFEGNIIKRLLLLLEAFKLEKYERKIIKRPDLIYTISPIDKEKLILQGARRNIISVIPIPFRGQYLYRFPKKPSILFIGNLTWKPNFDGIVWFIKEIYPLILKKLPNCKLIIAGKNSKGVLANYPRIFIKYINSFSQTSQVIKKLYKDAGVFIVPIKVGSGIRVKILDALSHGIPIVTTSVGAQGINLHNNHEVIITDNIDLFAESVIKILAKKNIALKFSHKGYKFMQKYYNSDKTEEILSNIHSS